MDLPAHEGRRSLPAAPGSEAGTSFAGVAMTNYITGRDDRLCCYLGTIRACLGVAGLSWFFEKGGGSGAVGLAWPGLRVGPTKNFFVEG